MFQVYNRIVNYLFPKSTNSTVYFPGIYGLRAIGILAVVLYNLNFSFMKGGLVGITVLFVVTGYLSTRTILSGIENTAKIDILGFYKKRAMKVFPSLVILIVVSSIAYAIFGRAVMPGLRTDVIPSLFQVNNWVQIFRGTEALGTVLPLKHLWALSVSVQFFVIWPIILYGIYRFVKDDRIPIIVTIVLAGLSVILMALYYGGGDGSIRAYYGTDSRIFAFLIGALLAYFTGNPKERIWKYPVYMVDILGGISLVFLMLLMILFDGESSSFYRGGHLLATILGTPIILSAFRPSSVLGRVLSFHPFVWLGKCSYGFFLWHYPIYTLVSKGEEISWWGKIIILLITGILAWLTTSFVEDPIRRGAIGESYRIIDSNPKSAYEKAEYKRTMKNVRVVLAISLALIIISIISLILGGHGETPAETDGIPSSDNSSSGETEETGEVPGEPMEIPTNINDASLLLIGDGYAASANDALIDEFSHILVDVAPTRSSTSGGPIYEAYANGGWEGEIVIYALANNGELYDSLEDIRERMALGQLLFIINTRMPESEWEQGNNSKILEFVGNTPYTYSVDWYGASEGHNEYFDDTGYLSPEGAKAYSEILRTTIETVLKSE